MKIQGYKIGNEVIGEDISTWSDSELGGNSPFIASNVINQLYSDITSISNWYKFGVLTGLDYTSIRGEILSLLNLTGFNNLNQEEKIIVSKYFLVSKSDRDSVISESDQEVAWDELVQNSLDCRIRRWSRAKSYISYNLNPADSSDLAISTSELCQNYVNYNITSNAICGKDGLFDFIEGTSGFSNSGFPSKPYWNQQYQNHIMNLLNGII